MRTLFSGIVLSWKDEGRWFQAEAMPEAKTTYSIRIAHVDIGVLLKV